jgi:hypothetical protein
MCMWVGLCHTNWKNGLCRLELIHDLRQLKQVSCPPLSLYISLLLPPVSPSPFLLFSSSFENCPFLCYSVLLSFFIGPLSYFLFLCPLLSPCLFFQVLFSLSLCSGFSWLSFQSLYSCFIPVPVCLVSFLLSCMHSFSHILTPKT